MNKTVKFIYSKKRILKSVLSRISSKTVAFTKKKVAYRKKKT
jgi:hypothetical protein